MKKIPVKVGEAIDYNRLHEIFKCAMQGGMRRSLQTNSLVLVANHTDETYQDQWKEGVFYFTGMGLKGDQSLSYLQNRTLAESDKKKIDIHLFEVLDTGSYTYRGRVVLAGKPVPEHQKDENGRERRVWMFPLKKAVFEAEDVSPKGSASSGQQSACKKAKTDQRAMAEQILTLAQAAIVLNQSPRKNVPDELLEELKEKVIELKASLNSAI